LDAAFILEIIMLLYSKDVVSDVRERKVGVTGMGRDSVEAVKCRGNFGCSISP
jgi:hypothetical protein